uniref:Uncharacterized protein n=1 Tax=Ixodes scapularis TaxID=6945 RepID=A0A4D5RZW4_IXOSC
MLSFEHVGATSLFLSTVSMCSAIYRVALPFKDARTDGFALSGEAAALPANTFRLLALLALLCSRVIECSSHCPDIPFFVYIFFLCSFLPPLTTLVEPFVRFHCVPTLPVHECWEMSVFSRDGVYAVPRPDRHFCNKLGKS